MTVLQKNIRNLIGVGVFSCVSLNVYAVTINEAIQYTLSSNPAIHQEANEVLAREQEIEQAASTYGPVIDFTAGIGPQKADNLSATIRGYDQGRWMTRKDASVIVDQMLFDGYSTKNEVERQEARVKSQKFRVTSTSENLALTAVEAYISVRRNTTLLALSSVNFDAHKRVYDQVSLRSKSGIASTADFDQVTGRKAGVSADLLSDEVNLRDAETAYLDVVGDLPRDLVTPKADFALPASGREAVEDAVMLHPTLQSANADVEATLAQSRAASHNYYPKLNLELAASWSEDQDAVHGNEDDLNATLRVKYNIYSGGRHDARQKQTAHLINEAKDVRDSTYRQVVESMRLSWASYQATGLQLPYLSAHVVAVKKTRDSYSKQFSLGKRTLLDLLDNENEVYQTERRLVNTQFDNLLARYRILVSKGTLLETLNLAQLETGTDAEGYRADFKERIAESALDDVISPLVAILDQKEAKVEKKTNANKSVADTLNQWSSAWESRNVTSYLGFYSDQFVPEKGVSYSSWKAKRKNILSKSSTIVVKVTNLNIKVTGKKAMATFEQDYSSNSYNDSVLKRLDFVFDGQWKIVKETVIKTL